MQFALTRIPLMLWPWGSLCGVTVKLQVVGNCDSQVIVDLPSFVEAEVYSHNQFGWNKKSQTLPML